jgi:hypothetical protein
MSAVVAQPNVNRAAVSIVHFIVQSPIAMKRKLLDYLLILIWAAVFVLIALGFGADHEGGFGPL